MSDAELYDKLKEELQSVEFEVLKPHGEREALLLCKGDQDLIRVAMDLALDNVDEVKARMSTGALSKLSPEQVEEISPTQKYMFLIVQPFVVIQEIH